MKKEILNSVKINDPSSLLKELLKHRHSQVSSQIQQQQSKPVQKNKFNCYSSTEADDESCIESNVNIDQAISHDENTSTPVKLFATENGLNSTLRVEDDNKNLQRRLSGRNLFKTLEEETIDQIDSAASSVTTSGDHLDSPSTSTQLVLFESGVKRKCIIKNFRKPRFAQWKSYWLQLVGGHLLIYYSAKSTHVFTIGTVQKSQFNKNPCKMHSIAGWMVVNLFQDKENDQKSGKYDVQLNDLSSGNMYKYRFDNAQMAKQWHEQFVLASTYHERQKPDNLIRFD